MTFLSSGGTRDLFSAQMLGSSSPQCLCHPDAGGICLRGMTVVEGMACSDDEIPACAEMMVLFSDYVAFAGTTLFVNP